MNIEIVFWLVFFLAIGEAGIIIYGMIAGGKFQRLLADEKNLATAWRRDYNRMDVAYKEQSKLLEAAKEETLRISDYWKNILNSYTARWRDTNDDIRQHLEIITALIAKVPPVQMNSDAQN